MRIEAGQCGQLLLHSRHSGRSAAETRNPGTVGRSGFPLSREGRV